MSLISHKSNHLQFTFGIVTAGNSDNSLNVIIDSIESQNIPEYQIVIIGNCNISRKNTLVIPFDEHVKEKWITKKKNLITENAIYDNVVYSHDYVVYEHGWYEGYLNFGDNFEICMNRIINVDYSRFRDWVIWPGNDNMMDEIVVPTRECLIPYDITHLSKYQYISGTYWVAKKHIMKEFPLNEKYSWGEAEDVIWSKQVREKYNFSINPYSVVRLLKYKDPVFKIAMEDTIQKLRLIK
jgi:hypothetical protein